MSETITKEQLKQLIEGIIREADASRSLTNIQQAEEIIQSLLVRGAKNNRSFRKYASDLRYKAKQADADIIRGEVEQSLAAQKRPDKRLDKYVEDEPEYRGPPPTFPPIPYTLADWERWSKSDKAKEKAKYKEPTGNISPETRAKLSAAAKAYQAKKKLQPPTA